MSFRNVHHLTVRNRATGKTHETDVETSGSLQDAIDTVNKTPGSVGAPKGFEVVADAATVSKTFDHTGEVDDPTADPTDPK